MHWTQAVAKSKERVAWRRHKDGRLMQRFDNGGGQIQTSRSLVRGYTEMRKALAWELEGYLDWQPQ